MILHIFTHFMVRCMTIHFYMNIQMMPENSFIKQNYYYYCHVVPVLWQEEESSFVQRTYKGPIHRSFQCPMKGLFLQQRMSYLRFVLLRNLISITILIFTKIVITFKEHLDLFYVNQPGVPQIVIFILKSTNYIKLSRNRSLSGGQV